MASSDLSINSKTIVDSFLAPYQGDKKKYSRYEKLAHKALLEIPSDAHEAPNECHFVKKSKFTGKFSFYARLQKSENSPAVLQIFKVDKSTSSSALGISQICTELHLKRQSIAYVYNWSPENLKLFGGEMNISRSIYDQITQEMKDAIVPLCQNHMPWRIGRETFTFNNNLKATSEKFVCLYDRPGKPLAELYNHSARAVVVENPLTYTFMKDILGVLVLLEKLDAGTVALDANSFAVHNKHLMLNQFYGIRKLAPANEDVYPQPGVHSQRFEYFGDHLPKKLADKISAAKTNAEIRSCLQQLTRYTIACILVEVINRKAGHAVYDCEKNAEGNLNISSTYLTETSDYDSLEPEVKKLMEMLIAEELTPIETIIQKVIDPEFATVMKKATVNSDAILEKSGLY